MRPILFTLHLLGHPLPIYSYGMMLVAAFLGCVQVATWLARRRGLDAEAFANAAMIALVTGVIGARLSHILENFSHFTDARLGLWGNLYNAVNIRSGGLTFYGGFILATPCCIAYGLYKKVPLLLGMDIVAPVLMVGLGFGRIGCFLNGCCYGERCDNVLGISFPYLSQPYVEQGLPKIPRLDGTMIRAGDADAAAWSLPVLPTQLYSSFTAFLLTALFISYFTLPHLDGRVFALMLMLEGLGRYVLEMVRVEPAVWSPRVGGMTLGFSLSMIIAAINIAAGAAMWWLLGRWQRRGQGCVAGDVVR